MRKENDEKMILGQELPKKGLNERMEKGPVKYCGVFFFYLMLNIIFFSTLY